MLDAIDAVEALQTTEDFCGCKRQYLEELAARCHLEPPECPHGHALEKAPTWYFCDHCGNRVFEGLACLVCVSGLCQDCIQQLVRGDPHKALQRLWSGSHCRSIGNLEAAGEHLTEALSIKRDESGGVPDRLELVILLELRKLQRERRNPENAQRYLREGLTVARSLCGDALNKTVAVPLHELAVLQTQSDAEPAEQRLADAAAA